MSESFNLKYRPQNFQDLDSTEARQELQKIFNSGKIPHAFLFSGPRGIGKTSAARIVAKAVNCPSFAKASEGKEKCEPCNQCDSCVSITSGTNLDVYEIDAASNRGIDDIKELREKIRLSPASSKYKVYIIDEVHMLTTEAFNALLKTLEEPPSHALFILCTTDPEKLPKTIISRCQRINFKTGKQGEIVERLKKICQEENLAAEEKALAEIAKLSDGSFRDAAKILERVSLEGKVTEEEVKKTAGILAQFRPEDFLNLLAKRKTKEALLWLSQAVEAGANLRILTESILEELRVLLLGNFGAAETTEGKTDLSVSEIKALIGLFSRAYFELKLAVIPPLPLEMAVIEWAESSKSNSKSKSDGDGAGKSEITGEEPEENQKEESLSTLTQSSYSFSDVLAKWPEILEKVKPLNHSVQAFLKACRPVAIDGNFLMVEVFYKFHKDQLETEKCRRIFEKAASEVLGEEVRLKCSLSEVPRPVKPLPTVEEAPPPKVAERKDDDIIKFAEEIFNKEGTIQ